MNLLTKMQEFFDSEECDAKIQTWADKINQKNTVLNNQLDRFHLKYGHILNDVITKLQSVYESDAYYYKWMNKGIIPPESLYWFIFEYAQKYGKEASQNEYNEYGNMFTTTMYVINDFIISRMDGQGSIIRIIKK